MPRRPTAMPSSVSSVKSSRTAFSPPKSAASSRACSLRRTPTRGDTMSSWTRFWKKSEGTAQVAKDRLQIIVARERTANGAAPGYLPQLQQELLQVIAKYEKVDLDRVAVNI